MNVMYSNISGGFIFAGNQYGESLFSRLSLAEYIGYFASKNVDVLSLSEVHLEGETDSQMVRHMAKELELPYYKAIALDRSHLDTSKKMGMAVLSRYPIVRQEKFTLVAPELEVVREGRLWKMHDKGGQRVWLDIHGRTVGLTNFSYFPFHHFGRSVNEAEFAEKRTELLRELSAGGGSFPKIVTGDLNCRGHRVASAFPELFRGNALAQAVKAETTVVGLREELDQIFYTPEHFTASNGFAEPNGSDHFAIGVKLSYKGHD